MRDDFPRFMSPLNWRPSSFEDVKKLNDDINEVAVSLADYTQLSHRGEVLEQQRCEAGIIIRMSESLNLSSVLFVICRLGLHVQTPTIEYNSPWKVKHEEDNENYLTIIIT